MKYAVLLIASLPILSGQAGDSAATHSRPSGITRANWDEGGDRSRWVYLHPSEVFPAAILRRAPPERTLPVRMRPEIANFEIDSSGHTKLSSWLATSSFDGFIVVHAGTIVYEQYPHMQPSQMHLIFSVTKAFVGTALGLLEDAGKVDLSKPIQA